MIAATGATGTGVLVTGGALTLTNAGSIAGPSFAIQNTGTGVSTISLLAGSTTGAIQLGSADDGVTLFTGNPTTTAAAAVGTIDLGTGANTITLRGVGIDAAATGANGQLGTLDLGTVSGLTTLAKLDSGVWTVTGAATGVTAGATILAGDGTLLGGQGLLNFTGDSGLTGAIYVNGAIVQANGAGTLGTGLVHLVDPTLVFASPSATYTNNFVLDVARPGQGSPSDASNDPSTFQANAGVTATLTGSITTGTGTNINGYQIDANQPLVIAGAGTIVLTNTANAWTGATTINSGATLRGTTASISGSAIVDNGTLNYNQATAGTSARAVSGSGSVLIDGGGPVTLTGAITAGGGVQVGAGTTTTLANVTRATGDAVTFTGAGATLIVGQGGSITAGNGSAVTSSVAGTTVTNAGTITGSTFGVQLTAAGSTVDNSGTIAGSAAGAVGVAMAGGTLTNRAGGVISAGQTNGVYGTAIRLTGAGNQLNLLAGSTVNGTIDASATTDASASYTLGATVNGGFTGGAGNETVTLVSPVTVSGTLDGGAGTDTLVLDGTGASTLGSAQVVNFENGIKQGSATWTLTGTTAASPTTFAINAGTLAVGGGNALADTAAVTVATGATLALNAGETIGSLAGTGAVTLGANTLTTGGLNASPTFAGVISGAGGLTKVGTGTLTLTGVNSYTGATTINGGTLAVSGGAAIADASAVAVATGGTLALNASETIGSLAGGGNVALGVNTLTVGGLNTATTFAGVASGTGGLTKIGTGVLTLAGANSYTGATAVNAGTLAYGANNALADTTAVTVAQGAILDLGSFSDTVGTVALSGTLNGTGTLTAATYNLNGAAVNGNLGAGTLTQAGGTSVLTGASAAATVTINAGTLRLGADERLLDTGAVSVGSGATFDLNGRTETVASVTGAGTTALGAGRLVLAGAGASSLGALTGTGMVDKTGTGTLTLANAYAATGSINTSAGATVLTGSTAGALRLTGGTLSGTGTAAGALTLTGGTVAPGTAGATTGAQFGTLSVGGLAATGGSYAIDFGGAAFGFASDLIRVAGAATLGGTVAVAPTAFVGNERFQQTYTVLTAGSLTGTFANLGSFTQSTADPALFYRLRYDLVPNAVVLQVQRQVDFAAAVPTGSANQLAVARALTGTAGQASDSFAATLNAIAGSGGDRGATYDSLSGEAIADVTAGAMFASDQFTGLLHARLGLHGGGAAGAAQYALRAGMTGDRQHASGLAGTLQDEANGNGGTAGNSTGVWLQGYGAGQRLRGQAGQARTNSFVSGLAGGLDGQFGAFSAGVAGGFTDVDTKVQTRGSRVEGTLYQGGAYVAYDQGTLYGQVAGDYYGGDVHVTRQLAIGGAGVGQATGQTNVHGYSVSGVLGVRAALGGGTRGGIEVTAQETQARRRAYTETAPLGLGLTAARDNRNLFTGTAVAKLSHLFTGRDWTVEPFASGGVEVHSGDLATTSSLQFGAAPTGTGGFLVQGATLEKTLGVFTGGVEVRPSDKFRIDLSAGAALGNRTREGQIKLSARIAF